MISWVYPAYPASCRLRSVADRCPSCRPVMKKTSAPLSRATSKTSRVGAMTVERASMSHAPQLHGPSGS